jgi:AraC family transcriptional regulator of adaptative response/methylated-DNA-[protein]-cysteine methyltransferase
MTQTISNTERRPGGHRPPTVAADDRRWQSVEARDVDADGAFVYAVRTTGIYCRPSCPSRQPRRENVAFFAGPAEATAAGYRACRRCRPHASDGTATDRSVAAARAFLDAHAGEPVSLARLARAVGVSPAHLQRVFTRAVGLSPKRYHDALRHAALRRGLAEGQTVTRAALDAGFPAARVAPSALGMTPGRYRRGGAGVTIRYAIVAAPPGFLVVGVTEHGVATVQLGESAEALAALVVAEFPRATLVRDDAGVAGTAAAVMAGDAVTLDLAGTPFQRAVWDALRAIPPGETRTYAEVAGSIGRPSAVRAVASACARNPAALVVPCHRVIRGDGGLGGYRWGIAVKSALLARESSARSAALVASSISAAKWADSRSIAEPDSPTGTSGSA